jgi:Pyruvate/2-oxoacid:ferredoxin oxidoreductase delta subunit
MANTALDEKKIICGNCYLYSNKLGLCLLTGEEVAFYNVCEKWLAEDTCKGCLIDFEKGETDETS